MERMIPAVAARIAGPKSTSISENPSIQVSSL
jgi:hypothetical protein